MFHELKEDFHRKKANMIKSATNQRLKTVKNLKLNPSISTSTKQPNQTAARRKQGLRKAHNFNSLPREPSKERAGKIESNIPNEEVVLPKLNKKQAKAAKRASMYNQLSYNWIDTKPTAISENDIEEADILDYETCAVTENEFVPSESNSQKITYNNHWLNNIRNLYPDMSKVASNVKRTKPLEDISCLADDLVKTSTTHVHSVRKSSSFTTRAEARLDPTQETYDKLQKFFIDILESTCNAKGFDIDSISAPPEPPGGNVVFPSNVENHFIGNTNYFDDDVATIHSSHSSIDWSTYEAASQLGLTEIDDTIRDYEKYLNDLLRTATELKCESLEDIEDSVKKIVDEKSNSCFVTSNTNAALNENDKRKVCEENAEQKLRKKIKKKLRKNEMFIQESTYVNRSENWDKPKGQIELFESLMKLVHSSVNNDTDKRYRLEYAFLHNDMANTETPVPRRLDKSGVNRGYSKKALKSIVDFKKRFASVLPKSPEKCKKLGKKYRKSVQFPPMPVIAQRKKVNRF